MLADFLLGPFRTRVLSALILHPETSLHARELARRIGALPGSTSRELVKLADVGIVLRQQIGNQVHYRANRNCPVFDELSGMLRKTSGLASILTDALQPFAERIQWALIFGSVARAEETEHSDVDVLVLGDVSFAEIVQAAHPAQDELKREVNSVVYKVEDFAAKLAAHNTWALDVAEKPKIFLIGDEDDFAKFIEDSKSRRIQSSA